MIYENFQLSTGNQSQGIKIVAQEEETVDLAKVQLYQDGTTLTNIKPPTPIVEEPKKSYLWVVLLIVGLLFAIVIIFFMLRKKRDISDENDDE
jgi:hypothetical protein